MARRTVRFYQVVNEERARLPQQLPFTKICDAVRELGDDDAYVRLPSYRVLGTVVDADPMARPVRADLLILDKIIREPRFRIEKGRVSRPLELGQDENLAEPTFYSLFENNVLGVMRNSGSAPGHTSVRDYLNSLGLLSEPIQVAPLVDRERLRALKNVDHIKRVVFAVGKDAVLDAFPEKSKIRRTIKLISQEVGHVGVDVTIRMDPADPKPAENLLRELEKLSDEDIAKFGKLEMAYKRIEDGRTVAFDFINEAIVTQAEVDLLPESQQPTEDSAAECMQAAFDVCSDEIQAALNALK